MTVFRARTQAGIIFATVALCGLLSLTGCATGGSKPPVVTPQPPPSPTFDTIGFFVHDLTTPGIGLSGALVTCGGLEPKATNPDGSVHFDAPVGQLTCLVSHDAYDRREVSGVVGTDRLVDVWLHRIFAPAFSDQARVGRLRLTPNGFADDSGPVLPLYAHAGDLFSLFTRDPVRAGAELDDVAEADYQGVRTWGTLGGDYWAGRHVGPDRTPDYWGHVRRFGEALRARGLRAVWSQGDVGQISRQPYMAQLAQIDNELGGFIDFIDCGNEAWQTGEPDPNRLATCVGYYQAAGGRAIRSLTSPPGEGKEELDRYSIPPAQVYDVHTYRDGHSWDKRRHIFSIPYEGKPRLQFGIGSEGPGNGALVSVTDNKHELDHEAMPLLAVTSMYSRQAFVWFSGEGVKINRGLKTEAGFWTTPTAVKWLPRDLMGFATLHHGGSSWSSVRVLAATGEGRADCRTSTDGRFACTLDGPPGTYAFPVERAFAGQLCNPGDSSCVDVSHQRGDQLRVTFIRGRVLVGQVR